jgi:probable HAF family extracellular repeat protein
MTATDLGTNGGTNSAAAGINNAGQVVGQADNAVNASGGQLAIIHATLWNGTTVTNLGTLGGTGSYAAAINNAGQIVGGAYTTGNANFHATEWNGTTATDLGALSGAASIASAINNAGQIAGSAPGFIAFQAALWNGTTVTGLGGLGRFVSQASGINEAGQVVGYSDIEFPNEGFAGTDHAVLWEGGNTIDLNSVLKGSLAPYVTLTGAVAINDNGWITADGTDNRTGQESAFLLTPVPLPAASWLLMWGLFGLGALAHRRSGASVSSQSRDARLFPT